MLIIIPLTLIAKARFLSILVMREEKKRLQGEGEIVCDSFFSSLTIMYDGISSSSSTRPASVFAFFCGK